MQKYINNIKQHKMPFIGHLLYKMGNKCIDGPEAAFRPQFGHFWNTATKDCYINNGWKTNTSN